MASFTRAEQRITKNIRIDNVVKGSSALVLFSGGMDSAVALYLALRKFDLKVSVVDCPHQGQTKFEAKAIDDVSKHLRLKHYSIEYPQVKIASKTENKETVYLGETNLLYYALAGNLAFKIGSKYIIGGTIKYDWYGRGAPQASPRHFRMLNRLLKREYGRETPTIITPLLYLDKREVAVLGHSLGVPFDMTRSCPKDTPTPCGKCSYCVKRSDALLYLNKLLRS